jgi:hypothetical protein
VPNKYNARIEKDYCEEQDSHRLESPELRTLSPGQDSCLSQSLSGTKQPIVSLILSPVAEVYLENPDGLFVSKPLLFRY